ncbi:uncharacterized protein MELLADRAFT_62467 [Melampsora larici-populina 98AG31]|uniref:Secreted protein n=1 Tax=Melampsora larici-populina (strain 98AG31 / pathotype 3-4-7) TaxID=747676 RepID=F4RJ29_MELLP|nr:uncharacterized protein MELLADRAFT_62467 [Melampsora larici-populina 98AG31]EGG07662.1 hypothetical protein MELLADRAFT_62467 [Melampsora larici-populina 98AG31]
MRIVHCYILILLLAQSTFCSWLKSDSVCTTRISSSNWEVFTPQRSTSPQLKESQHEAIIAFWRQVLFHYHTRRGDKSAGCKLIHQILTLKEIPFDVLQVLHPWLLRMYDLATHSWQFDSDQTRHGILAAIKISGGKYIEHIRNLGDGEPLMNFVNMQRNLERYGMVLSGDWSSQNQRELYEFWISEYPNEDRMGLYYKVKHKPHLQLVLETQVVQTRLIEHVKHIDKYAHLVGRLVLAQFRDISEFIKTQEHIHPYGLEIQHRTEINQMKVIQFWSTYVDIFLLMHNIEDTKALQTVIEDFVVEDFDEVCIIMRNFINTVPTCTAASPALAQFLKFYSEATQYSVNMEVAQEALDLFVKESAVQKAQAHLVNNEVAADAEDHSWKNEVPEEAQDQCTNKEVAEEAHNQCVNKEFAEEGQEQFAKK